MVTHILMKPAVCVSCYMIKHSTKLVTSMNFDNVCSNSLLPLIDFFPPTIRVQQLSEDSNLKPLCFNTLRMRIKMLQKLCKGLCKQISIQLVTQDLIDTKNRTKNSKNVFRYILIIIFLRHI